MEEQLQKYQNKALFWRRMAYIYRNGNEEDKEKVENTIKDIFIEGGTAEDFNKANKAIMPIWEPIYEKFQ